MVDCYEEKIGQNVSLSSLGMYSNYPGSTMASLSRHCIQYRECLFHSSFKHNLGFKWFKSHCLFTPNNCSCYSLIVSVLISSGFVQHITVKYNNITRFLSGSEEV